MAALIRKPYPSPNYSSRGASTVRLIVLHTAEGARTIEDLGSFFSSPSAEASSHVGIDDTPGTVGEYVKREWKAWTCAGANPISVNAELCAWAEWDVAEWNRHPNMLANTAAWIAEEAKAFGLPITKLTPEQAQSSGRGVCQHGDLGDWGGGHWDCGPGFPIDQVLSMARAETTQTAPPPQASSMPGYPDWFWDWADWYLTTDRDPEQRPPGVPITIPQWAWDGQKHIQAIATRYGMTAGERDWLEWYLGGKKGDRPAVPTTIPPRWWDDERWVLEHMTS